MRYSNNISIWPVPLALCALCIMMGGWATANAKDSAQPDESAVIRPAGGDEKFMDGFFSGKSGNNSDEKSEPLLIDSERMTALVSANTIKFSGNVVATRGGVRLKSSDLEIRLNEERTHLESAEAEGSVEIEQPGRQAWAERMIYTAASDKITLQGNARVVSEGNTLTGDVIHYFRAEDRLEASGRGKPAGAVIDTSPDAPTAGASVGNTGLKE